MSNRVSEVRYLWGSLRIRADVVEAHKEDVGPEDCFLSDPDYLGPVEDGYREVVQPAWQGECSFVEDLCAVLTESQGEADLLVVYESTELLGIRVMDGAVSVREVVCTLGDISRTSR